ncbi:MAG TPA: DUF2834 domain-containing protein [Pyrinomonadaceae bacterium]|nr:DUF2834 domain-containing protein [Pyrinomonadaceae bacterium]
MTRSTSRSPPKEINYKEETLPACLGEIAMQWFYLIAAIVGTVLPLSYLFPFLTANGFDVPLLFRQLFQNNVSAFFGTDVIVSSVVLWFFVFSEGRRRDMKNLWVYILGNLLVGVSLGLPLFLFFRERKLQAERRG